MFRDKTREDWVGEFNRAGKNKTFSEGGSVGTQVTCFSEELLEFNEALADYVASGFDDNLRPQMIKEWADVQVTLSNLAWFFEFDGTAAFNRVAQSNMSKVVNGELQYREDGKILKGPNYVPPDMKGL